LSKLPKILLYSLLSLIILLAIGISLTIGWRPFIGPKSRPLTGVKFESTPQRLERGRYLFNGLALCVDCHSPHDPTKHGAPIIAGREGSGEVMPVEDLPGKIVASNLTPDAETGSGNWTDDQLARAIREGIGHDGRTLFPMMPYERFRHMSDEDLASIVVYIRSMPAVRNELPRTEVIFPVKYLIRTVPEPVTAPVSGPDSSNVLKRGEYLANLGSCGFCHTPQDRGQVVKGMEYAGGLTFQAFGLPGAASANITPDPSGISYYDETLFMQVMRTGLVKARELNPIMPYQEFKELSDQDLKDLFAFLRTVKPVHHRVDNSEPPTDCKLCRLKHGGGAEN